MTAETGTEQTGAGYTGTAKTVPTKPGSRAELRAEAARARAELARTLDAIEYKLNLPKQIRIARRRITLGLRKLGEENPAALVGIVVGAAAVVGSAVWLGVKAVRGR